MVSVDELYRCYWTLVEAKENASNHQKEYITILRSVKGEPAARSLVVQFIPKFLRFFPTLMAQAFECQLDLCEDQDQNIRRQSTKKLIEFSRIDPTFLVKVADVLMQLTCVDDETIVRYAKAGLEEVTRNNSSVVMTAALTHLEQGDQSSFLSSLGIMRLVSKHQCDTNSWEPDMLSGIWERMLALLSILRGKSSKDRFKPADLRRRLEIGIITTLNSLF